MEKSKSEICINLISEENQEMIVGGGGWAAKALLFIILNWDDINSGFTDGFNSYHR